MWVKWNHNYNNSPEVTLEYLLNQLLEIVDSRSVDAVLIAGDVYDKAIPSEAATRMLDYFLSSLAKRNVYTYMINGNHDSDERLNYGSNLFETNHIFISTKYDGKRMISAPDCMILLKVPPETGR